MRDLQLAGAMALVWAWVWALSPCARAEPPDFERVDYAPDRFLVGEPEVVGFDGPRALLEFETVMPAPGARVYYGITLDEEDLAFPRYRKAAKEMLPEGETGTTSHRVTLNLASLEDPGYGTELIDGGGGHIEYRLEVFDPRESTVRFYESRFRYTRTGDPETGTYKRGLAVVLGPFVDMATHDSAVISWETDRPARGAVLVGGKEHIAEGESTHHEVPVLGLSPDTEYAYRVKFSPQGDVGREYVFRTAPEPGSRAPFTFGFIADSREGVGGGEESINALNAKDLTGFLTALYRHGADFVCFGGDLVNGYTSSQQDFDLQLRSWKRASQPVAALIPVYEAMGNHEQLGDYFSIPGPEAEGGRLLVFTDRSGDRSAEACFARAFTNPLGSVYDFTVPAPESRAPGLSGPDSGPTYEENVYSFNYGNVHIVALNTNYWYTGYMSSSGYVRKPSDREGTDLALELLGGNREGYVRENQLDWLERDLTEADEDPDIDWVFVFLHEPAFPNGGHVEDAMYWGTVVDGEMRGYNNHDAPLGDVVDMRNRFWKILDSHEKVLALLAGDEHNYSRMLVDADVNPEYRSRIWQITSGGCGAPYYARDESVPWSGNVRSFARSKHCCLFDVSGLKVGYAVYGDRGQILDRVEDLAVIGR
jgi:3',5'-cyclic AMP phosphodiesterase CpdA